MSAPENNQDVPKGEPEEKAFLDEEVSYSFLFFMVSGALLFVTLWAFWDDEYSRRGFKHYQEEFYKTQFERSREELKEINEKIASKEQELKTELAAVTGQLENSEEYQKLADVVREAEIHLGETQEKKKFAGSRVDEAYYYYKKAMHAGENYDVQKAHWIELTDFFNSFDPEIKEKQAILAQAEAQLMERKARQVNLEKELRDMSGERTTLLKRLDYYKPFNFFWKPAEILQTVIPGFGRNNFKEIIYRVDRCMTCHISYRDDYYRDFAQPLKTHPNMEILIDKHPPERTGCTWCHYGQGSATAPAEDAHGSHHEMDQTVEVNEPILQGNYMQSTCRNCHDDVINLEGAPILSKGKQLFQKLGCHGCHLADGFTEEAKVGPRLTRIGSKVNGSWLFRWVKKPRDYLPQTRMPDFSLSDRDAMAVSAYLLSSSEKNFELPEKYTGGDPEEGQTLFESVGCLACHQVNGKGEVFGPDLTHVGKKVNADWLVSWLSKPKLYNHQSIMPELRLSLEDANNIASFLLQFDKPAIDPAIETALQDPKLVGEGEWVVRRRGCFACHDINGMENEGRIAPELSSFGRKQVLVLEFGDAHVPHTWENWVRTKLKNPSTYRTERVLDKMPDFYLSEDEIDALVVLLKGFNGTQVPEEYRKIPSPKDIILEKGRRLITKYNCRGCHHVEGDGGRIQKYLAGTHLYPPPLELGKYHVGERLKGSWLFSFLKNPTPVRTWVKVRMPTFFLTDREVRDLTAYFEALSTMEIPYEEGINVKKHKDSIETGVKIVNYMDCGKCHDDGAKGIDFSIASERLRQNWIPNWLKNTRELIPWTKMPAHWDKEGDNYVVKTKFQKLKTVGDIDNQVGAIRDFITSYNTAEFNDSLVLGEDSESADAKAETDADADSGDDEEEEDEDDDDEDK
ncbi:MAG: cytochrome C [Nitrospinae bacterium CG11_big_fil_rev_8_21_14_0_20_56_8]|nr:MAG: cytochrome C [Nitrospinae bacterium CG11_big_fil_rev_8_21_14_0_20_56_8]